MNQEAISPISRVEPDAAKFEDAVEWAKEADRDVRVRVELRLYNPKRQRYAAWPRASLTLDVRPDPSFGDQLLKVFELLALVLSTHGPGRTIEALDQLLKGD